MKISLKAASLIFAWFLAPSVWAALSVSPIFGSDMVLQRGTAVPVFGTTDPGATVNISFQNQNISAVAASDGSWRADLSAMPASTSASTLTVTSGTETVSFAGVQVGEVWLCSGQSNMGWPMSKADDSASAIADAGNHNIRLFRMTAGNGPSTTTWKISNSTTVEDFSAVCYWMGLELSQWFENVPVGLIQATHDGTAIESWTHLNGGTGEDYDAMVKPIQPFAVQAVSWYQGESNGGDSAYATKLTGMIGEWRGDWARTKLPFGIVQLHDRSSWTTARNAQLEVADSVGDAFLVVIRDLPGGTLHPTVKKPVGIRTAIGARGLVYGDAITWSGPIRDIENSYVSGNTVILKWKHLGNGLFTNDGAAPGDFKVAGSSGNFTTADAVIVGDTIEVSSSSIANPTRVQYAYSSNGNLYNHVNVATEGGSVIVDRLKASEFQIEVTGSGGGTENSTPTASFTFATSTLSAEFDGSGSSDSDGTITSWDWNFGDGNTASGELTSHTFAASGDYMVTLTVTDDAGASASQSKVVSVSDGTGGVTAMHVQSITTYTQSAGGGLKNGVAEVVIVDNNGSPVSAATVTGTFSGSFSETVSAQTGTDGKATLVTSGTAKGNVSVSFCVDDVTHSSIGYDASKNTLTCTN
jgi:sialate O-acetylesterase